ncbi:c-type cytochrome [Singulisphaera rosea]
MRRFSHREVRGRVGLTALRRSLVHVVRLVLAGCFLASLTVAAQWGVRPWAKGSAVTAARVDDRFEPMPTVVETPIKVGRVTYASDIAAIFQAKCQSCHRPDQVAPFSLLSYDEAQGHAAMIREVVDRRRMPPWHADPRFGHFQNDRSLSALERAKILTWIDQGTPLGDPKTIPPAREFPKDWSIGSPDVIFEMSEGFTVPAQGIIPYQYFRVPTHFTEDKWVQAIEAHPGNREVVHHFIVRIDTEKRETKHHGHQPYLVGYAPGDLPAIYEPGTAKRIPAGADLIFAVHYTPVGTVQHDRSSVGLVFAKSPVEHEAVTQGISQEKLRIPPYAEDFPVRSQYQFRHDSHMISLTPHMHLRGKSFRFRATYPDGRSEVLLSVPQFSFGWQSVYRLADPSSMPKGTRIDCLALFDNSAKNPDNPDPKQTVIWGEQTFDEMMIGFIDFYRDRPASRSPLANRARSGRGRNRRPRRYRRPRSR